ncbi:hypothetical protein [Proteiniphilum sp. UBA1028]|uniref:hypothetical protein n=1 Tax=Proteiniphilum sp. UBA1028 TaxID=1947251 RepID=UPI0026006EF4|nr:hypothetical protein [Proteiniphilum sp. UBA1028]
MRFTIRLFLYWVSIFLIFYIGIQVVVYFLWGMRVEAWQGVLVFLIVGVIPPALITAFFSKRLDYMESEKLEPPSFSGQKKAVFQFKGRSDSPFDEVMQRIDRQWIISYSDRKNRILKFRTDARMTSWGLGGYLKMEDEETVTVIVYPIRPRSKRDRLFVNQTLRLVHSVLNP